MSDTILHIVPVHEGDYPDAEQKAQEILQWFLVRDMVKSNLSDCTLGNPGYRFQPNIATIFHNGKQWGYRENLHIHGLELHFGTKRIVFHPMEGEYLILTCPHCNQHIKEPIGYQWVGNWAEGQNIFTCTSCGKENHLTSYSVEPEWGFSNIGISLWNTHWDVKEEFISAMEALFKTPVVAVNVRI